MMREIFSIAYVGINPHVTRYTNNLVKSAGSIYTNETNDIEKEKRYIAWLYSLQYSIIMTV